MEKKDKLKSLSEIRNMVDKEDMSAIINYVDWLHGVIKDYQIVIDMAVQKDKDLN